ncbi:MAG: antibiotic biosynthesis monooxygenase [Gammaproteobacteria bacterium]|nr:antibiotic biosynthesis monooxygenase [Gammaproteobacteria bacterium]
MHVTLVHVYVKPEHIEDFIRATQQNHEGAIHEPGNVRFDVLQSPDDATRFVLYEAYLTPGAAAAHKQMPHYLQWRERVAPWMAKPREGVNYHGLLPVLNPE